MGKTPSLVSFRIFSILYDFNLFFICLYALKVIPLYLRKILMKNITKTKVGNKI